LEAGPKHEDQAQDKTRMTRARPRP